MYSFQVGEAIQSRPIEELTSPYLVRRREEVDQARKEWERSNAEIRTSRQLREDLNEKLRKAERWQFLRALLAKRIERLTGEVQQQDQKLARLTEEVEKRAASARLDVGDFNSEWWGRLNRDFSALSSCGKAWDVTSELLGRQYRSLATAVVERTPVNLRARRLPLFDPKQEALHVTNANGADLYIYPDLLIVFDRTDRFALIDLHDVRVEYTETRFHETEPVPPDTRVVGHTWRYANNDGSPDRRFSDNRQIPIVLYGTIHLSTATGLNEEYQFSDPSKAHAFASALSELSSTSDVALRQSGPPPNHSPAMPTGSPSKYDDFSGLLRNVIEFSSSIVKNGFWPHEKTISSDITDYFITLFTLITIADGSIEDDELEAFGSILGNAFGVPMDLGSVRGVIQLRINEGLDPTSFAMTPPEFFKAAARFDLAVGSTACETMAKSISVLGKAIITSDGDVNEIEVAVITASLGFIKQYLDSVGVPIHVS